MEPAFRDAPSREAYEVGALLMEGLSTLNGPLRLRDGRNDWMRDFASALEGDHNKLSRLLLALEKNLPWKAMRDGFDKTRQQVLEKLAAINTPAQAAKALKQMTRDIRPDHWLPSRKPAAEMPIRREGAKERESQKETIKEVSRRKNEGGGEVSLSSRKGVGPDKAKEREKDDIAGAAQEREKNEKRTRDRRTSTPPPAKRPCSRYNELQTRKLEAYYQLGKDRIDFGQVSAELDGLEGGREVTRENVVQWFSNKTKWLISVGLPLPAWGSDKEKDRKEKEGASNGRLSDLDRSRAQAPAPVGESVGGRATSLPGQTTAESSSKATSIAVTRAAPQSQQLRELRAEREREKAPAVSPTMPQQVMRTMPQRTMPPQPTPLVQPQKEQKPEGKGGVGENRGKRVKESDSEQSSGRQKKDVSQPAQNGCGVDGRSEGHWESSQPRPSTSAPSAAPMTAQNAKNSFPSAGACRAADQGLPKPVTKANTVAKSGDRDTATAAAPEGAMLTAGIRENHNAVINCNVVSSVPGGSFSSYAGSHGPIVANDAGCGSGSSTSATAAAAAGGPAAAAAACVAAGGIIELLHTEAFAANGPLSVRKGRATWLKEYQAAVSDCDTKRIRKSVLQLEKNLSWKAMDESFKGKRDALIESARCLVSGNEAEQLLRYMISFIHPEFYLKRLPGSLTLGGVGDDAPAAAIPAAATVRSGGCGESHPRLKRRIKKQATWLVPPGEIGEWVGAGLGQSMFGGGQERRETPESREMERERCAGGSENLSSSLSSPRTSSCFPTPSPADTRVSHSQTPSTPPRVLDRESVSAKSATGNDASAANFQTSFTTLTLGRRVRVEIQDGGAGGAGKPAVCKGTVGVITQRLAKGKFRVSFREGFPDMDLALPSPNVELL